ncbi:MAG: type II toxin-antitoxin system RelE/ParE family toxin [Gemmatimonadota bacterium]
MELVETLVFTRQVTQQFGDEEYRGLQLFLLAHPDAGPVIPRSGGLRKVRWRLQGRGKRGGARIIYYWSFAEDRIYLLFLYPKNVQADLTAAQITILRKLIAER